MIPRAALGLSPWAPCVACVPAFKTGSEQRYMEARQLEAAKRDRQKAESMEDAENREAALANVNARIEDIHSSFDTTHHELDYARKIYLIEN